MDGRKALLRNLIVASLATTSTAATLVGDDFIRPPAKNRPAAVRVGTITQPATPNPAPTKPESTAPAPATAPASVAAPPAATLELEAPEPAPTHPILSATGLSTPAKATVPAQTVSSHKSSSALNWQPRGGRPSLSVEHQRAQPVTKTPTASKPVDMQDVPQVPVEQTASPEVRLVVPARPEDAALAEQAQMRRDLAHKISAELAGDATTGKGEQATAIEPGPGWQAVGEELQQHVRKCEELLSRKAYLSAMQEADQAITRLVRVLDLKENRFLSEPAWAGAVQALREAQEFTSINRIATDPELFTRLIQSHETPVLKETNVAELTPLVAAQHYRAYAEQSLVAAAQGHPWFSELYYCLGRSLQSQAEANPAKSDALLHQALAYYRAAGTIDPSNATNANQLGYVLLRLDRPAEALTQLQQVVQLPNCPLETWQNLAQASSRLGDAQTEKWAVDNYMVAKSRGVAPSGPVNTLVQVSEEQFRAMSPRGSGPSGALPVNMAGTGPAMQMNNTPYGNGPVNYNSGSNNSGNVPAQASAPEQSGRTAILPRTGLFR